MALTFPGYARIVTLGEEVRDPERVIPRAIPAALVLTVDLRGAISFPSFGVLIYHLIANLSAFRQNREHRRFPTWLQVVGALSCAVLAVTLPLSAVISGAAVSRPVSW